MRIFFVTLIVAFLSAFSSANATSDWVSGLGYKARLIEGSRQVDGTFQAAFEIVLEKGWSTYWRVPGEHGIPPIFEFNHSSNVKDAVIHWPAPDVFIAGAGLSIGYKDRVVLPFTVTPETKNQKVELNVVAFFGVCSEICVPADANASVSFYPQNKISADQPIIDEAFLRVPSQSISDGLDVKDASFVFSDDAEYVYLQIQIPENANNVSILTEGPQDWFFDPYVTNVSGASGNDAKMKTYMAKVSLYRHVRTALSGEEQLRVTVITDGTAIEKMVPLGTL